MNEYTTLNFHYFLVPKLLRLLLPSSCVLVLIRRSTNWLIFFKKMCSISPKNTLFLLVPPHLTIATLSTFIDYKFQHYVLIPPHNYLCQSCKENVVFKSPRPLKSSSSFFSLPLLGVTDLLLVCLSPLELCDIISPCFLSF